jgi:NHLM bacteriocin system ABC transporter ATP-binding protein
MSRSYLKSNTSLFLNDSNLIWRVRSGSLPLFASYQGTQHYLFSVRPGEILLPAVEVAESNPCKLMVKALQEVELDSLTQAEFYQWLQAEPQLALTCLENWVTSLSAIAANLLPTVLPTPIAASGILTAGEVFQPEQGQISWVRLTIGQVNLCGHTHLTVAPQQFWLPLTGSLWLQAHHLVELNHVQQTTALHPQVLVNGAFQLQGLLLQLLQAQLQQEQNDELNRLLDREAHTSSIVDRTQTQFVEILQSQKHREPATDLQTVEDFDTALLAAAGAIGKALGITINPPVGSEDPSRLQNPLEAIALASRLRIRPVTLRDHWWKQDAGPLLAYTIEEGRPLALLPCNPSGYDIYDPIAQTRQKCHPTFAQEIASSAYTFYRSLPDAIRPLNLLQFISHGRRQEGIILIMTGIAGAIMGMVTPQATALLIGATSDSSNSNRLMLLQIAGGLVAAAVAAMLFQMTQNSAMMRLETFADATTQSAVWDRVLKLKPSFFRSYLIGDLTACVSGITQIRQRIGGTVLKSLFSSIFSFLNLGLLFYYSPPLALIATVVAAINMAVTIISGYLTLKKIKPLIDRQGKLGGVVVELINGVSKFRVAAAESRAFAYWGQTYSQQLSLMLSSQGIEDNLAVINSLLSALTPAVLFAFSTHLMATSNGTFTLSTFLAFNVAFGTFIAGATSLSTIVMDVMEVIPIWQRVQPILQAEPEVNQTKVNPGRLTGQIKIDQAVFRYRSDGNLNLDNVSIHADPGEFIALVGPSGSGKSTLLRLILGFDTPESGKVVFDDKDLASLDLNAVRRQLGVVLQSNRLMSGSIFENIAGGKLISMDEAWAAVRMAGLIEDIEAMPMKMHTVISEGGSNLSGGQRQRLLIARALALRPRILIFDEATSALDNRTQQIVSDSLDRLKVTRIVVAHRLSTIRNADRIYVLEAGRIVQKGNFEQLASESGLFAQLVKRQQI